MILVYRISLYRIFPLALLGRINLLGVFDSKTPNPGFAIQNDSLPYRKSYINLKGWSAAMKYYPKHPIHVKGDFFCQKLTFAVFL